MREQEKWQALQEILLRSRCTDDAEFKDVVLAYNEGVSREARRLHEEAIVIDCCTAGLENANWMTEASGVTAMSVTVPDVYNPNAGAAIRNLANIHWVVHRSPDKMMLVDAVEDIITAKKQGKTGIIRSAQHVDFMLHRDLEGAVEVFQRAGFRIIALACDERSFAADGCLAGTDGGLTRQGKALIRAMEANGVTVDLSRVGERSFFDALSICSKPVVCSNSNPRALFPHPANLTDDQMRACIRVGGVICLTANPALLWDGKQLPTIDRYLDAIEHTAGTVGIDAVAIGTGLPAQPGGWERHGALSLFTGSGGREYPGPQGAPYLSMFDAGWGVEAAGVKGMGSIACFPYLTHCLTARGFSEDDIKKMLGNNLLRVFRETWR